MFCDVQYWLGILVQDFGAVAVALHECGFLKPFNFFLPWFCTNAIALVILH